MKEDFVLTLIKISAYIIGFSLISDAVGSQASLGVCFVGAGILIAVNQSQAIK